MNIRVANISTGLFEDGFPPEVEGGEPVTVTYNRHEVIFKVTNDSGFIETFKSIVDVPVADSPTYEEIVGAAWDARDVAAVDAFLARTELPPSRRAIGKFFDPATRTLNENAKVPDHVTPGPPVEPGPPQ